MSSSISEKSSVILEIIPFFLTISLLRHWVGSKTAAANTYRGHQIVLSRWVFMFPSWVNTLFSVPSDVHTDRFSSIVRGGTKSVVINVPGVSGTSRWSPVVTNNSLSSIRWLVSSESHGPSSNWASTGPASWNCQAVVTAVKQTSWAVIGIFYLELLTSVSDDAEYILMGSILISPSV